MKRPDNNLLLVIIFAGLFFLTGLYLFVSESHQHDLARDKRWTACYLTNPGTKNDLSFMIENYEGSETSYTYSLIEADGQTALTEEIRLGQGDQREVKLPGEKLGQKVQIKYLDESVTLMNL